MSSLGPLAPRTLGPLSTGKTQREQSLFSPGGSEVVTCGTRVQGTGAVDPTHDSCGG